MDHDLFRKFSSLDRVSGVVVVTLEKVRVLIHQRQFVDGTKALYVVVASKKNSDPGWNIISPEIRNRFTKFQLSDRWDNPGIQMQL